MATVAKGMITLNVLNDAFSVSLSPNSCVINANFDGSNPKLNAAYTNIKVTKGDRPVRFQLRPRRASNSNIRYDITTLADTYTHKVELTEVPNDVLSGFLEFDLDTEENFQTIVTFQFTVVRESTMLDWIQEWETNKTKIGSTYLITPKIFVGKRVNSSDPNAAGEAAISTLTGVYIGPDGDNGNTAGIYGLYEGEDIFHINKDGGLIGGWEIHPGGIQTSTGSLKILSDGHIRSVDVDNDDELLWEINADGSATFSKGNVKFLANGSAEFTGKITSYSGEIGGWTINQFSLYKDNVYIDSYDQIIGILASTTDDQITGTLTSTTDSVGKIPGKVDVKRTIIKNGGVCMFYESANSYGLLGYLPPRHHSEDGVKVFSFGSSNFIAGWQFDEDALWLGENKYNTAQNFVGEDGVITIGTHGLRGKSWYIDADGEIDFMNGLIHFDENGGTISGWKLNAHRFSSTHTALISDISSGVYLCVADISDTSSTSLVNMINQNGGIYMRCDGANCQIAAYDKNKQRTLLINSHGANYIGGWNFDYEAIWHSGAASEGKVFEGFTTQGGINISPLYGIRGHQWRLEADGSGGVAGDNIWWESDGTLHFTDSVKVMWNEGVDILRKMAFGKMLYRDPEFSRPIYNGEDAAELNKNFNSTTTYLGKSYHHSLVNGEMVEVEVNNAVTRSIVSDGTALNDSKNVMQIVARYWYKGWDRRVGGFAFINNQSRANAQFIVRIIAKIPVGWYIENYHNSYGVGASTEWLTSQDGTGEYQEYLCLVKCGSSGSFSTINHFALKTRYQIQNEHMESDSLNDVRISIRKDDSQPWMQLTDLTWYVSYATVIDISSSDKLTTTIDKNGIYTGTLRADQIVAGTIDATQIDASTIISNGDKWALNKDGSGYLAGGNISWLANGNLTIEGKIKTVSGTIGGWIIDENALKSENDIIRLVSKSHVSNGSNLYQGIYLTSATASGGEKVIGGYNHLGATIKLVPSSGTVQTELAQRTDYSTGIAYISPTGIFANLAGTQATGVTGATHRASIVGLGFGNLNQEQWELGRELTAIAGVYGRASNSGTAPAYGGLFHDLKAYGLVLNRTFISDATQDGYNLTYADTYIVGITNKNVQKVVYLPTDGVEGRVLIVKQMGQGSLRIDTRSGQKLYDDDSENDCYYITTGQMAVLTFQVFYINNVRTEVWSINRFGF